MNKVSNPFKWLFVLAIFCHQTHEIFSAVQPKNILVICIFCSKSSKNFFEPLVQELANRGHKITSLTPFKSSPLNGNIKDILGPNILDSEEMKSRNPFEMRVKGEIMNPIAMAPMLEKHCRKYYDMPELRHILNEKFDLILSSYTFNECGFGIIHKLGAPFILMHMNVPFPWNNPTHVPYPLSFIPLPFFGYSDHMSFVQRFINFGFGHFVGAADTLYRIPKMEQVYRDALGEDLPGVSEIAGNVSLILANSHWSVNYARPVMPSLVEVGGMHCSPAKPLPKVIL